MIFTSYNPNAHKAQIIDEHGNNLCKKYLISTYDTGTQTAGIFLQYRNERGELVLKLRNGQPIHKKIHLPGSKLVFSEPLNIE